jgi:hypothetical protein
MDAFYLKPKRYIRSADPIDTSLVTPTKADLKTGITKANTPRPTTQASKQSHHYQTTIISTAETAIDPSTASSS